MGNDTFLGMLAESPFTGLQEHMKIGNKTSKELQRFLKAVSKNDWKEAKECRKEIVSLENQADDIKNSIRNNLPKSLFMSVSRQDLLDLVFTMDGIPNAAKDISGVMIGRQMLIPEEIKSGFIDCANAAIKAANQASNAVKKVDQMQRSGFSSSDANLLEDIVSELEKIEKENDELEISLRTEFFKVEKEYPPVDVMFLYDVINKIGSLADISQTVGHVLIRLVSK